MKVLSITAKNNQFAGFDDQEVEIEIQDDRDTVYITACDNAIANEGSKLYSLSNESIFSDDDVEMLESFDRLEDAAASKFSEDYSVADKILNLFQDYISSKHNS